jgi:hypothetical protein
MGRALKHDRHLKTLENKFMNRVLTACIVLLVAIGAANTSNAVTAADTPASGVHHSLEAKRRDCVRQAAEQKLTGDEARAFVARCVAAAGPR